MYVATNVNFNDEISLGGIQNLTSEVDSLTGALTDMRTEITLLLGKLNEFVDTLSTSASEGNFLQTVCGGLAGTLSTTSDVLAILSTNLSEMKKGVSVFSALAQGFGALKTNIPIAVTALGSWISTSTIAIAVQSAWNAVTALFPGFLVIAAVAGLILLLVVFVKEVSKASETQKRLNAETQALKESTDELNKSLEESKAAYAASTSKIETNAGAAEILAQKIYALSGEENKSAKAKRWLSALVERLNSTMLGRNLLYNAEADYLSQTTEQEVLWMAA